MKDEFLQSIFEKIITLHEGQGRIEGKVDDLIERTNRNELNCNNNLKKIFNTLNDHDERLAILETKAGKHNWMRDKTIQTKIKIGISLGGAASFLALMLYGLNNII